MLKPGTILGNRYVIIGRIGSGGMSDVYKAKCTVLNRTVAVKVLKDEFSNDRGFVEKFRMEAQSAAGLSHNNIVSMYDVGEDEGVHYIVMELIEGLTLKRYIERKGKLEIREAIEVAMQVAKGIEAAHNQGIIHRDIKSQNIMISKEGKIKVTDFGIARATSTQTISSNTMGSVHYISPEQARGGYCDERSDIYSLGITMYEMLTGRLPFEGDSTVAIALLHIQGEMTPPRRYEPMIPISLEKIILKCTQKKPEYRYGSMGELLSDLRRLLTMPGEDFVKIAPAVNNGKTSVFTGGDVERIKRERAASANDAERRKERAYQLGLEVEESPSRDSGISDADTYYHEESMEEDDNRFEKIITFVMVGVAILILLIVIAVVFKACGSWGSGTSSSTPAASSTSAQEPIPYLVGKDRSSAVDLLVSIGIAKENIIIYTEKTSDAAPDVVLRQDPAEGRIPGESTKVTLWVAAPEDAIVIPNSLSGKTVEEAKQILYDLGLNVMPKTGERNSSIVAEGLVTDTDPSIGSAVNKGDTVQLILSIGPAETVIEMPTLIGRTEEAAIKLLMDNELRVGEITKEYSNSVAAGLVISQTPTEGTEVSPDTAVSFVISKGKPKVPNLYGKTLAEAERELSEAGLSVGSVSEQYSNSYAKGLVIGCEPGIGEEIAVGQKVSIIISLGHEPSEVPEYRGMTVLEYRMLLSERGLTMKFAGGATLPDDYIVVSVSPGAGSLAEYGSAVTIHAEPPASATEASPPEQTEPATEPPAVPTP